VAVEVEALSRVPLLAGLERPELELLAGEFREHTFPEGATITREGRRGARVLAFFIIAEGRASVVVGGETKATLGPGDYFGEIALMYDLPRTATVSADTDLRCFALSAWEFRPFVEANPKVAWPLLESMAQRLSEIASS
jgi:CRP/FNR family cyclic AMP-dependent transcriptional regulator